jgi:hypothetical protein
MDPSDTSSTPFPAAPPVPPALDRVHAHLAHAAPAGRNSFRVAGERIAILGDGRRGVRASQTRQGLLTGPIGLTAPAGPDRGPAHLEPGAAFGVAANILQAPGLVRRELFWPGATGLETVVVPERLEGFAVQWQLAGPGGLTADLEVALPPATPIDPTPGGHGHEVRGGTIRLPGAALVLHLAPASTWVLDEGPRGTVARVRVQLTHETPLTLLVAALDSTGSGPSLTALAGLNAHRRRSEYRGTAEPGIRVETGVRELDEGVGWSRALLMGACHDLQPPFAPDVLEDEHDPESAPLTDARALVLPALLSPAAAPAWAALAALAAGEHATARLLLPQVDDHPLAVLARAEWVAWTGDAGPLLEARVALSSALTEWTADDGSASTGARIGGTSAVPDDRTRAWRVLAEVARERLADAAEAVGEGAWAAALREPAGRPATATPSSGGGRLLPTLGGGPSPAAFVRSLFGADPQKAGVPPTPDEGAASAAIALLLARERYAEGFAEAAFPSLRHALGAPVVEGPPVSPLVPSLALWTLVTGLLGLRADAAYGRLRLAPQLPATWNRLTVRGLALGDATLDLHYEHAAGRHQFRMVPTGGAVPVMLILEPALPVGEITRTLVDGRPAEFDAFAWRGRTVVRLQLPLDSERSLTVDGR